MHIRFPLFFFWLLTCAGLVLAQHRPLRLADILPDTPHLDSVVAAPPS